MGLTGRKPSVWLGSDPFLEALGKGLRPAFPASGGSLDCVVCGPFPPSSKPAMGGGVLPTSHRSDTHSTLLSLPQGRALSSQNRETSLL